MTTTGKCKTWNAPRGYGFITSDDGVDYFCHCSGLRLDRDYLEPGERVTFTEGKADDGRARAVDVELLGAPKQTEDEAIGWLQQ